MCVCVLEGEREREREFRLFLTFALSSLETYTPSDLILSFFDQRHHLLNLNIKQIEDPIQSNPNQVILIQGPSFILSFFVIAIGLVTTISLPSNIIFPAHPLLHHIFHSQNISTPSAASFLFFFLFCMGS